MLSRIYFVLAFLLLSASASAQSTYSSEYSSLESASCKEIANSAKPEEGIPDDSFQRKCPGHAGYSVEELGGDMRSWLVLQKGATKIDLYGTGANDMVFPNLHLGKLEWRYRSKNGSNEKELVGIIFRMAGQERKAHDAGNYKTKISLLYALRLGSSGHCLLGVAKTNEEARRLVDQEGGCVPSTTPQNDNKP